MSKWPKLSETLTPATSLSVCQSCGQQALAPTLQLWQECDDDDQRTRVVIVLCPSCAKRIIEPHPRLYGLVDDAAPLPGAMPVCDDCSHRRGLTCTSPAAMFNGGPKPGLLFQPMPQRVHLCRSPRSKSGWAWLGGPIETCSGKTSPAE